MALIVRPAGSTDYPAWARLWRDYLRFYETEKPEEMYRISWARILDPAEKMHSLLAVDDGRPVGLANFLFHRSFWEAEDKCYLNDLYVDPDGRGKGVGRALISGVYKAADLGAASQVWWFTAETNATARRLYDTLAQKSEFVEYVR